jgi:hypothetical protein
MRFRKMSEQCAFETARAAQEVKAGEMVCYRAGYHFTSHKRVDELIYNDQ